MIEDTMKYHILMRPSCGKFSFKIINWLFALMIFVLVIILTNNKYHRSLLSNVTLGLFKFTFDSSSFLADDVIFKQSYNVSSIISSKKKLTIDEKFKSCAGRKHLCQFSEEYSFATDQLFFIETVGSSLKPRAACGIESAVRNSNKTVKIVFVGNQINQSDEVMSLLVTNYPQLQYYTVNIEKLARGLPVEKIVSQIESSKYRDNNYSNILRALLIYHFGGMYLDSDFIVLKPLNFFINFTVPQSTSSLNNAVLSFSPRHPFIWSYMKVQGSKSLFPPKWGIIGPAAMTEAYKNLETYQNGAKNKPFLLNADYFYPYRPNKEDFDRLFDKNEKPDSYWTDVLDEKKSLAVHLWNAASKKIEIKKDFKNTIFSALAPKNCPVIFESELLFSTPVSSTGQVFNH